MAPTTRRPTSSTRSVVMMKDGARGVTRARAKVGREGSDNGTGYYEVRTE